MTSKQASPSPTTRKCACNCTQVKFTITGTDKNTVLCHCANCQQSGGSAFMYNHRFLKSEVQYERGESLVKAYKDTNTISGNTLTRHFCSNCGCPLFLQNSAVSGFTAVHCALMEGSDPPPRGELFRENKYAWLGDVGARL